MIWRWHYFCVYFALYLLQFILVLQVKYLSSAMSMLRIAVYTAGVANCFVIIAAKVARELLEPRGWVWKWGPAAPHECYRLFANCDISMYHEFWCKASAFSSLSLINTSKLSSLASYFAQWCLIVLVRGWMMCWKGSWIVDLWSRTGV